MKTPDNTPLRSSSTALTASAKPLALLGGLLALSALGPIPAWAAAEPVTACTAEPTNMTITFGDLVDCAIDQAGDSDLFQFSGSAGGQYLVSLLNLSHTSWWDRCSYGYHQCPIATLYNPDMSVLGTLNAGDRSDVKLVTLPSTGTYRIVVRDDDNGTTLPYRVGLERLFPASPTAVSTDFGLANPAEINPRLDQDLYTFDGVSGALVNISQGGNGMKGMLYGPDKSLVETWTGSQSKFLTLPQTGAYTFHAFDDGNTDTQSYNFEPVCLTPPPGYVDCKGTPDGDPPITCNGLKPTLQGTAKSERITGTAGNDVIVGLGGNDRILGLGGNDVICGNSDQATAGSDTLLGGEGNDTLIGNGVLLGEAGNDSLKGGTGRDSLLGGPGDDTLDAQGSDDLAIGGAGNDKLLGGAGANDLCDKDANDLTPATGCELRFTP